MTLREYIHHKGLRIRWISTQIGMSYHAFWCFLRDNGSLSEDHAKRLEILLQGDWVAVPNKKNRLAKRWEIVMKDE